MQELYKEGNTLVSLAKWQEAISSLDITPSSLAQISTAFEQAVLRRVPKEPFGLFLSGGVDSTLIAHILKKHNHSPICFTVGTKDSQDIEFAKRVAGGLSLEHHIVTLDDQDIKSIIQELKVIFKDHIASNPVVLFGVGAVEFAASRRAQASGLKHIFSGLGAEDVFGGYNRHKLAQDVNKECLLSLSTSLHENDLRRCDLVANHFHLDFLTPFLDKEVIRLGLGLPSEQKVKDGLRKLAVADLAMDFGVPQDLAFRQKKGAQYGSAIQKSLERISKGSINSFLR